MRVEQQIKRVGAEAPYICYMHFGRVYVYICRGLLWVVFPRPEVVFLTFFGDTASKTWN